MPKKQHSLWRCEQDDDYYCTERFESGLLDLTPIERRQQSNDHWREQPGNGIAIERQPAKEGAQQKPKITAPLDPEEDAEHRPADGCRPYAPFYAVAPPRGRRLRRLTS